MTYKAAEIANLDPINRRSMADAPRDGTKIYVARVRRTLTKTLIVRAHWRWTDKQSARGFWQLMHTAGVYAQDDDLLGWWPIVD